MLNMADGAIGYLEDDGENHKIFSVIAKALKNGGKHFMDIINGSVFENHNGRHCFPFYVIMHHNEAGCLLKNNKNVTFCFKLLS